MNIFFKDVRLEFNNINWTDISELRQTAFIILLIIFCTSLFLWIIDSILTYIVSKVI
ncbi:MAG TPA: preprotein translocase subunit SecE [Candidatus Azoamicus sp.]